MAVRQYIGARYVPRFMGAYDATTIYEALDVVDNGQGTSYISKVPTPAGTPLTDTTHWAIYGTSSGAIINLQNQIDTINGEITGIQGDITNLDNVLMKRKKKVIFIGDSYGTMASPNWVDVCASFLTLGQNDFVNKCVSGGGFIYDPMVGEGGNAFLRMLESVTQDRDTYTDIICCGGINDARGSQYMSSIYPNIRAFISYALTYFPNAQIHIGFIGSALEDSSVIGVKGYHNRVMAIQEYIKAASPYYLTGVENILHTSELNYDTDRFHPSVDGSRLIGQHVANAVLNNGVDVRRFYTSSFTRSDTTFTNNSIVVDINNDYTQIGVPEGFMATFSSPVNISRTYNNGISFTLPDGLFFDKQMTFESTLQITRNGTAIIVPCIWFFVRDTVTVCVMSLNNSGTWETISTNYIYVNAPLIFTVPTVKIN